MNLRRPFLLLACCIGYSFLSAQVTISDADMPAPGDLLRFSLSDSFPDYTNVTTSSGTGQSWNYTWFAPFAQRSDSFVAISAVPFTIRFFFPFSSNLALYIETPDSIGGFGLGAGYQIYQVSPGAYQNLGFGGGLGGIPITLANSPSDTILTLPLQAFDADSSVSTATLSVPGLIFYSQVRKRVWEADADGQLTTPFGTFASVRVHSVVTGQDSLIFDSLALSFTPPVQEEFTWYSPDYPGALLTIGIGGQDSTFRFVSSVSYADSLRDVFQIQLGLTNPSVNSLGMYPNPATDQLHLDLPNHRQPMMMKIFAMDGRTVWSGNLLIGQKQIQLPALTPGIYQVIVESDEDIFQGKLKIE